MTRGFNSLLEGVKLIFKPGIRHFVILPLTINILVFSLFFVIANHYIHDINQWLASYIPHWLGFLSILLWLLFAASFLTFFIYFFTVISNLIAAPFNSLLSERVELYLTGNISPSKGWVRNVKDIPRELGRQLSLLGFLFLEL